MRLARPQRAGGGVYLRLSADRTNAAARRFYAARGFYELAEESVLVVDGAAFAGLTEDDR